jgi:tetratricopeptide (TPR) repeat protein
VSSKPSIFADPGAALRQARALLASDPAAAVKQARQLLKAEPRNPALLRIIGAGLRKLGKDEEAEKAELEAIAASTQSPGHREAARALAAGDNTRANAIVKRLLAEDDSDVVALVMLGLQASASKEWETADTLLRKAVALAPADPSARMALAEHYQKSKRSADALEVIERMPADAAGTVPALSLRAAILKELGCLDEELEILDRLKTLDPKPGKYQLRIGHALRTLGQGKDAAAAYRELLKVNPREGTAWWSLANLKTAAFSDDDIAVMKSALDQAGAPLLNRIRLNFALGKAHEDRRQPEEAYRHYAEANRLRLTFAEYRPEAITQWVDGACTAFTSDFFTERDGAGCPARDPIFIIGMQRSGSTLVEQIVASHSQIEGTAELTELPNIGRELGESASHKNLRFGSYVASLGTDGLRSLGETYLQRTRVHRRTDRPLFADKMPNNWMYVGLIRAILPNAKIVDVRRHPLACGFSNWKQLYGRGLEHSYSMEHMAGFYAAYVRLMRHFDSVQPGKIHRVIYERLVEDFEAEVGRLLDYLEVPFDKACLDFHATERSVRTISAGQVRRPINREGLKQWRDYERWLDPMKQALGTTLEDWDA